MGKMEKIEINESIEFHLNEALRNIEETNRTLEMIGNNINHFNELFCSNEKINNHC